MMNEQLNMEESEDTKLVDNALVKWKHLYDDELKNVDKFIVENIDSDASLIINIISHILSSGGKRIRPILTILSAKLCGYEGDRHVSLATAIEFFHTATLLHDDVVDESSMRRGSPTANSVWDNSASVLVGDYLLSKAFQIISRDGSLKVLRILSDSSAIITEGEVKQLMATNDLTTNKEQYIDIISSKTSQLFVAACQVGAVISEQKAKNEKALESFGRNLGTAFQIIDDTLDYSAKQEQLGKEIGDDFREGKVTLPIILAYQRADKAEKRFLERSIEWAADGLQEKGDFERAVSIIDKYDVLEDSIETAKEYANRAKQNLSIFPDGEIKQSLLDILDFSVSREY